MKKESHRISNICCILKKDIKSIFKKIVKKNKNLKYLQIIT